MKNFLKVAMIFCFLLCGLRLGAEPLTIKQGSKVSLEYTLTVDNQVLDSSEGKAPLEYTHGAGQIIPGLEKGLEGLKAGDEKIIIVQPKDGYGDVDPKALKEILRSALPPNINPQPGMMMEIQDSRGNTFPAMVAKVEGDKVIMDLNHPLAGKTLHFKIRIVKIE